MQNGSRGKGLILVWSALMIKTIPHLGVLQRIDGLLI